MKHWLVYGTTYYFVILLNAESIHQIHNTESIKYGDGEASVVMGIKSNQADDSP